MNPTMADEEQAYNAGLVEGIRLIGEVVERQPEAEALIHYTFAARKKANAPVADIPPEPAGAGVYGQPRSEYLRRR